MSRYRKRRDHVGWAIAQRFMADKTSDDDWVCMNVLAEFDHAGIGVCGNIGWTTVRFVVDWA
jgi:hypothetical protein